MSVTVKRRCLMTEIRARDVQEMVQCRGCRPVNNGYSGDEYRIPPFLTMWLTNAETR